MHTSAGITGSNLAIRSMGIGLQLGGLPRSCTRALEKSETALRRTPLSKVSLQDCGFREAPPNILRLPVRRIVFCAAMRATFRRRIVGLSPALVLRHGSHVALRPLNRFSSSTQLSQQYWSLVLDYTLVEAILDYLHFATTLVIDFLKRQRAHPESQDARRGGPQRLRHLGSWRARARCRARAL